MRPLRHFEPLQNAVRRFRKRRSTMGAILMYHRVLPAGVDVWRLNVSPEHFAEQLEVLRARMRPVSLRTLVEHIKSGRVESRSVAVTFDDGYANNLELGVPALERCDVPATVFVTTGYTGAVREFWWDDLERLLVHERALPQRLELTVGSWRQQWDTGSAGGAGQDLSGTASSAAPGSRLALYHDVWLALRTLSNEDRQEALAHVRAWSGTSDAPRSSHRAMTRDEVARMAAHPLMEIGAHTVSHPRLTDLTPAEQRREIAESRATLEAVVDGPVTSFSYPFGAWAPGMRAIVRQAGFECATTTMDETAWHRSDVFSLPRFMVEDWDGAEFDRRLSQWFDAA